MKRNETTNQNELESINGELFQSFDPEDASWITGGKITWTFFATNSVNGALDSPIDIIRE